jgi:hypothetical protein
LQDTHTFTYSDTIVVVSGLPRSGTSMMMQMLIAGGLAILTDNLRKKDENNSEGYLEFERVKKLKEGDFGWLNEAKGKAVKVVSSLLEYLPGNYEYKIIFMNRDMEEILASQEQMLHRLGKQHQGSNNDRLGSIYQKHLNQISSWLRTQNNMEAIYINYNQTITNPDLTSKIVADFLGTTLDISNMVRAVYQDLYHHRNTKISL